MGHRSAGSYWQDGHTTKENNKKSKNTQTQPAQRMQFRLQKNICEPRTSENAPLD